MVQPTDDYNFERGFYVIGVFDVLGQRSRLIEPISFPPTTEAEAQRAAANLQETTLAVDRFRQLFRQQFDDRRRVLVEEASRVPGRLQARFETSLAWNLVDWGMSDTWCVAVRLEAGTGAGGCDGGDGGYPPLGRGRSSDMAHVPGHGPPNPRRHRDRDRNCNEGG